MTKEASPAGVANNKPVSSPSEPSWYQEPTSGFLSASLGELGQSKAPDLIACWPVGAARQVVVDGHRAEPAARDHPRLETSDAPGGRMEQRSELLTGQERVARNQGEYLVDLAWWTSALPATVGQRAVEVEHAGTQRPVVGPACHLLQQRPPRLRPRARGARRGRDADDQNWLFLLLNMRRPTQF